MEDLRIATPPRAARARKRHDLPEEKKRAGKVATFFITIFGGGRKNVKEAAKLRGLEDDEDDEDDGEGSQAGSTIEQERGSGPQKTSMMLRLKARARKYLNGDADEEVAWNGTGVPPWVERGSSIGWSEDKSRQASEYGDNFVDFLTNPRRILAEPPVFFDPVEDRVRSRWLPVFALCAFPAILATVMLLDVWDKSALFKLDERPVLKTLFRSGDPMLLNMLPAKNMSLKLQALNRDGWPLQKLEIKAHVADSTLAPSVLRDLPFCSRTLLAGDETVGNAKVCQYLLYGASAVTDRDGVATFTQLTFQAGLPGAYRLQFHAEKALLNVTEWFSVKASISRLIVDESYAADTTSGTDVLFSNEQGLPFKLSSPAPAVRLVVPSGVRGLESSTTRGAKGLIFSNLTVFAINLDPAWHLGGALASYVTLSPNPEVSSIPNTHVALVGNSAAVDSNGVAMFPELAVAGYDRPYLLLAFVCQGQVLVWSKSDPPAAYNVSQYSAARGGWGAFPSIAYISLPSVASSMLATAAQATPSGITQAFEVTEGMPFGIELVHDASLAGAAFVAKLRASPGASVDIAAVDLVAEEAGVKFKAPAYHKLLLGDPPMILLSDGGKSVGTLRTSLFGKPGKYTLVLYFMGSPLYTFDLTILEAVEMLIPGALPDSTVLCGMKLAPVCRHDNGKCSFGKVAGTNQQQLAANAVCDGIQLLTQYSSAGDGLLPFVETYGKELADGNSIDSSNKLVALEMVEWGVDVAPDGELSLCTQTL